MGKRDWLRSVDTVSGREYAPAPKSESLRSVERVRCEPPPPKNNEASVVMWAVSGACREPELLGLKGSSGKRWLYWRRLRRLRKMTAATIIAIAPNVC
jgi:hypothetical protein